MKCSKTTPAGWAGPLAALILFIMVVGVTGVGVTAAIILLVSLMKGCS